MAAPVDAGSIYSDVRIRLDRLTADIKAVNTGFDKLGKNLRDNSDKTTKKQTENFKQVGLAGVAAIGAITLAFKKSVSVFAETEQSLANVEAVSNATAAEFRELEQAASDAGTTTRFTARQAADALFFLSSAGLSATESVKALDGVLLLAGATGSDLAFSAQAITSTLSQFGLAADKAADVSNIFAAANSNSQATLDKLASSLRQAGPVAAGLGIGLEEVVGSLQALFNAGFKGEQAGTALRNALADLANQSSPTIEKLEALGVSFESVNPEAVGLTGAIGALADAGLSTGAVIEAFGKEVGPQLLTLIKTGQKGLEEYTTAVTGTNEAARQYAVQNDTLAGSFDALKSAAEGTSNSFISTLTPVFRGVLDLIAGFLRVLNKVPDLLKGAGAGAGIAAGGFIALSKALALIGVTLSTGPLAIIAGLSAVAVGLTVLVSKAKEAKEVRLAEEFGDLARELGYAGQAVDDFTEKAGKIEDVMTGIGARVNMEGLARLVSEASEGLDLTKKQVIEIGLQSKKVTSEYKDQLIALQNQLTEQELINQRHRELTSNLATELVIEQEIARIAAQKAGTEARLSAEEQARLDRLDLIRERLTTLDELQRKGAISEIDLLEEKKSLREEEIKLLLDQALASGVVSDQVIADIKAQEAAVDRYDERLQQLLDDQKKREEEQTDNAEDGANTRLSIQERSAEKALDIINRFESSVGQSQKDLLADITEAWKEWGQSVAGLASNLFSSLDGIASGAEASELQRLDAQIQATEEGSAERLKLEEEFDQKKRQIERDQAIRKKAIGIFDAGIDTFAAIIGFLADPGGIPGLGLSIAAGVVGASQVASIASQPLPALQTGGIILPKPGGTAAILAENGSPELALNAGAKGADLLDQFAQRIAKAQKGASGLMTIILERDGRQEAQTTVNYINNGIVRLKLQ